MFIAPTAACVNPAVRPEIAPVLRAAPIFSEPVVITWITMRDSVPAIGPSTPLDQMTPAERDALIDAMVNYDNDEAGPSHFVRGNPIYASPPDTPKGLVEKRFPDGRLQFVRFALDGEHVIVDAVQTVSDSALEP